MISPTLFNLSNFSLLNISKLPSKNKLSNIFGFHFPPTAITHLSLFSIISEFHNLNSTGA